MVRAAECGVLPRYAEGAHCPGCAGTNWIIGRRVAECGRCHVPLPLPEHATARADTIMARGRGNSWRVGRRVTA